MVDFSIRDFTDVISEAERRPDSEKLFNQIKGLAARKLLSPLPHFGPKGALLFAESEIYRARVLLAAVDLGVSSDRLANFDAAMRAEEVEQPPFGPAVHRSLSDAIGGLSRAEDWVLQLVRIRSLDDGEIMDSISWIVNGAAPVDDFNVRSTDEWPDFATGQIEAVLLIPFSRLVRSIFDLLRHAEG